LTRGLPDEVVVDRPHLRPRRQWPPAVQRAGAWNAITRTLVSMTNTTVVNTDTMCELLCTLAAETRHHFLDLRAMRLRRAGD
jgi:hypothetical protein